jgi:hypothetical protein
MPRPQAGSLAAVFPTAGHAVQQARAGQGATAGRPGIALQAPATARTGTGQAGALLQPGIPYLPTVSPAGQRSGPNADRDSGTSARVVGPGRRPRQVRAARIGKAISRCTRRLRGPEGLWSVQPPAEGPQQRLAGDAEQFVVEEASLV